MTKREVTQVVQGMTGCYALRDWALIVFSERIGFHVSELLSLCVRDVWQQGRFVDEVALAKRVVERQTRGRTKGINQPLTRVVVAPLAP